MQRKTKQAAWPKTKKQKTTKKTIRKNIYKKKQKKQKT